MQFTLMLAAASAALPTLPASADDGELVTAWSGGGRRLVANDPAVGRRPGLTLAAGKFHLRPDGRMLLAGTCSDGPLFKFCAAQVRADGVVDTGFGPESLGQVRLDTIPGSVFLFASAVLQNGAILLAGRTASGGLARIARLTANGLPDPGLGAGAGFVDFQFRRPNGDAASLSVITAIGVLADGKILIAGGATNTAGDMDFAIARLLPDLSVDTSFGIGGSTLVAFDLSANRFDVAIAMAIQADGRIVLAGHTDDLSAPIHLALVARLAADGQIDTSFSDDGKLHFTNGGADLFFYDVAIDRQQRIVLAGSIVGADGNDLWITRVTSQGVHDLGFGVNGNRIIAVNDNGDGRDVAHALALQSDGRILVAGQARRGTDAYGWVAARVLPSGHLDTSFGAGGTVEGTFVQAPSLGSYDIASGLAIGNGGLMLAGVGYETGTTTPRFGLAKLSLDGVFTDGFQAGDPAIVALDDFDLPLATSLLGTSVQWHTGLTCQACDQPPFHFTVWGTSQLRFFWPFTSVGATRGAVAVGDVHAVLQPGASIGPESSFSLSGTAAATANWRQAVGVDGYLGFRFQNPITGQVNYGYARISTSAGGSGFPATLHGFAYNRLGAPITIP